MLFFRKATIQHSNRGIALFYCLLLINISSVSLCHGTMTEREQFIALLDDTYQHITNQHLAEDTDRSFDLLTSVCEESIGLRKDGDLLREQSRQEHRNTGLELRGAYSTGDLSETDEGDDGFEQGRANLELSWDILKHGYFHNAKKAHALELEAKVADLSGELRMLQDEYLCRRYQLKKEFSSQLIQLLNLKLDFMRPVHQVERRAYFKQWSFLDDYLVSEEDVVLAQHELDALLGDPYFDGAKQYEALPAIIDVDLQGVLEAIRGDDSYSKLFEREKEWLEARERAVVTDSLRVYLRQEYDVDRERKPVMISSPVSGSGCHYICEILMCLTYNSGK